jgi:radical SAM enzyme (TIGR01210 family)
MSDDGPAGSKEPRREESDWETDEQYERDPFQALDHDGPARHHRGGKSPDPRKFVASWSESDELDGLRTRAWVLILRTSGCSWARCTMCGYHGEAAPASADDIVHQFTAALERRKEETVAKIYTSGSFFDDREVPAQARRHILGDLGKTFRRVVIESRPEHVSAAALKEARELCPGLEVAMGLESSSERVLAFSVRKGFTFKDFAQKARLAREHGARVRAYILLKPPFLTEREAMDDAVQSILEAAPLCDTISLNPVNVQRGTVVEQLWKRRIYRPPWLWTACFALLEAHRKIREPWPGARLVCAPSGAGQERGVHNCGLCDTAVTAALEEFSLSRDPAVLERTLGAGCECTAAWRDALGAGAFAFIPYDGCARGR